MAFRDYYDNESITTLLSSLANSLIDSKTAIRNRGGSASNATGFANLANEIASIPLKDGEPDVIQNVLSVMGQQPNANGDVNTLTASLIGAAVAGCNWQSATKAYRTKLNKQIAKYKKHLDDGDYDDPSSFGERFEGLTPEEYYKLLVDYYLASNTPEKYLTGLAQGCWFVRVDNAYEATEGTDEIDRTNVINKEQAGMHFCIVAKIGGEYVKSRDEIPAQEEQGTPGEEGYVPAREYQPAVVGYNNRQWMIAYFFMPSDNTVEQKAYADLVTEELVDPEDESKGYKRVAYEDVMSMGGLFDALTFYLNGKEIADRQWVEEQLTDFEVWKDVYEQWMESDEYSENASCTSESVKSFLWSLEEGQYCLPLSDGTIYLISLSEEDSTVKYRWTQVFSSSNREASSDSLKKFEVTLYEDDVALFTICKNQTGEPYISLNGTKLASISDLTSRPTAAQVVDIIYNEFENKIATSNVRTTITKSGRPDNDPDNDDTALNKKQLKIVIENSQWIINQINAGRLTIDDCKLVFMMNSRKRGSGYRWWNPNNYDSETTDKFSKIGYANLNEHPTGRTYFIDDVAIQENFPPVPSWMPNNGYLETEIPLTMGNLINGYVFINQRSYFLPMLKPAKPIDLFDDEEASEDWGTNIAFVSTSSKVDSLKSRPILCSFAVSINGNICPFNNAIKVGCIHDKNKRNLTSIEHDEDYTYINNIYTSIV